MRALIFMAAALAIGQAAEASAAPTEIVLASATQSGEVSGTTRQGDPTSFTVRSPARRDMTIKVAADNRLCGFEMRRSSVSGFQPEIPRFPGSRTFNAQEGETFTFSFFQTRSAFVAQEGCSFTLSVN